MISGGKPMAAVLCLVLFFSLHAQAKSVQDFEALPVSGQSEYIAHFVDKMTVDVRAKDPALAQQIHAFFYKEQPGKPMSEGLENIGVELISLDTLAKRGKADLSQVQIEPIIVFVTRQKFKPQPQN